MATKKTTKAQIVEKNEKAVCQTPSAECECEMLKKQNAALKADIAGMEKELTAAREEIAGLHKTVNLFQKKFNELNNGRSVEDAVGAFSDWTIETQCEFLQKVKEQLPYTWGAAFGHAEETKEETPAQPTIKERLAAGEDVPVTAENASEVLEALR